jgi:structural maintenance of chromosome 4
MQSSKIEEELKNLQDLIMEAGGVKFRSQKGKVDSLNDQIEALQHHITKFTAERSTREKNLKKVRDSIQKKESSLNELEVELEGLTQTYEEVRKKCYATKEEVASAKEVFS